MGGFGRDQPLPTVDTQATVKFIGGFAADRVHLKQIKWGIQVYGKDRQKETPSNQLRGFHPPPNIGSTGRVRQTAICRKIAKANHSLRPS